MNWFNKSSFLIASALLVSEIAFAQSQELNVTFSARLDHHSDAVALKEFGNDDRVATNLVPRAGRNLAYIDDEIRVEATTRPWTVSWISRTYAQLVANDDALDVFSRIQLGVVPSSDRDWRASLKFNAFAGSGLSLAYVSGVSQDWKIEAQGLRLDQWRNVDLSGVLGFRSSDQGFSFNASGDRLDHRQKYPFMSAFDSHGWGLLVQGSTRGVWGPLTLQGSVRDIGYLRWRGIPRQIQTINSNTQSYDNEGYLIYKPLLTGYYEQSPQTQWLRGRWALAANWRPPGSLVDIGAGVQTLQSVALLPWVQGGVETGWGYAGSKWDVVQRRLTLSLTRQHLHLAVGADALDSRAKSVSIMALARFAY